MKIIALFITFALSLSAIGLDAKIAYLGNVKELIVLTQKMRGNTNVYAKGGKVDKTVIEENRKAYAASFEALNKKFKSVDSSVDTEFNKLNRYMQSLNKVAIELDTLTAFKANTLLIKEMLRIGAELQENFFLQESALRQKASAMMFQQILPLSEYLGQLRGLSAGAVACHRCREDDDLEYIKDYLALAYDDLDTFVIQMKDLKNSYPKNYSKNLDIELEAYQKEVHAYLDLIETVVVKSKEDKGEYDFFKKGTELITKTLKFYAANEEALKNQGI